MTKSHRKLTEQLMRTLNKAEDGSEISVIVRYSPRRRTMRHREVTAGVRESYNYHLRPFTHLQATPAAIATLEGDPDVECIYQDLPVRAYLDTSAPQIRVPLLWEKGFTGEGVRIAIIDTGIDPEHPDLKGRVLAMTDFTGEGALDQHGHGTHCAGVAAGSGQASGGRYRGVAPEASLYSARVLRSNGEGMMSDVMAGIDWAVDQGAQILSLSLGGPGPSDGVDALSEMCEAAVEAGVIVCVAAGNDGPIPYSVGSPGCARQVITIGACNDLDRVADFSSRGPTADGRLKPDIVFPGVDVVGARAAGTVMGAPLDAYYTSASGTSMAAPHAAGACALLLQADPTLTPQEIKTRILGTAVDLGVSPYAQGRGRADMWLAYESPTGPVLPDPELPAPGPAPGQGCLTALLTLLFFGKQD